MEMMLKKIVTEFVSLAIPRIKNSKAVRDFKDRWMKDNYHQKMLLMFQAGVDDAKALLDIPEEVIKELLEDKQNRQEIFSWIAKGISHEELDGTRLSLEPYYERYPEHQDKFLACFQLILLKINEYKEKNWAPEILNILQGIDNLKELRHGISRIQEQQGMTIKKLDHMHSSLLNALGPVGYEDLKDMIRKEQLVTARKRAEERLKHARSDQERLELNAVMANSLLKANREQEAIPFLYAAISNCTDEARKNRLLALINIIEKKYDEAQRLVDENVASEGYTVENLELLVNLLSAQKKYEECVELIEKHGSGLNALKAHIYLLLGQFEPILDLANKELENKSDSKEWLLMKAEAYVLRQEKDFSNDVILDHDSILKIVSSILERAEEGNENDRQLCRINELKAAANFRAKRFNGAATYYEEAYKLCRDESKDLYFRNMVWANILDENWAKCIPLLEKRLKDEDNIEFAIVLARGYLQNGDPRNALAVIESLGKTVLEMDDPPLEYWSLKMEIYYRLVRNKEILSLIAELEGDGQVFLLECMKGHYSMLKDDWDDAVYHFQKAYEFSNEAYRLEVKIQLIGALRKRGTKEDCRKLEELIPTVPHWLHHEMFVNDYIFALYQQRDYETILRHYQTDIRKPSRFVKEIVATIYSQSEWYRPARDIYEKLFHQTNELKFLFRYSYSLFRLGETEGCLNSLQLAEKKVMEDATIEDLQLLSLVYLEVFEYEKAMEYAYLTFKQGEKSPEVWRFYFWHFIRISDMIPSVESKFAEAYKRVWTSFNETFPDESQLFTEMPIDKGGKLPDNFMTQLKSMESFQRELEEQFVINRLPLQTFMEFTRKEPSVVWGHVASHRRLFFYAELTGSEEERRTGIFNAYLSKWLLCDLFSILTLEYLDLLNMLAAEFQLFIYQDQFNYLFREYSELKLAKRRGLNSLGYENGQLKGYTWNPAQVEESIAKKQKLINWINENCEKLGSPSVNPETDLDILTFDEQLQLCKQHSLSLLADSFIINNQGRTEYGVHSFSVVDLIRYLCVTKKIDNETHDDLIGKLVIIGYRYLWVPPSVFIRYLSENDFSLEGEVEMLFNYLREEAVNREYVFGVVTEVLRWICHEHVKVVESITGFLCDVLIGEKNETEWLKILLDSVVQMEHVNEEARKEVGGIIKARLQIGNE